MNQECGKLHENFLKTFYRLVYLVKIHQVNNPLLMECIGDFKKIAGQLLEEDDDISFQVSRGNIIIQDEKLLNRREIGKLVNNILQYFEKRDLQGLCFFATVQEASDKEIIDFGRILNESEQHKDPQNWFVEQMEEHGFAWVENVHEQDTQLTEQASETELLDQEQLCIRSIAIVNLYV